jgi:hypothetical protein
MSKEGEDDDDTIGVHSPPRLRPQSSWCRQEGP